MCAKGKEEEKGLRIVKEVRGRRGGSDVKGAKWREKKEEEDVGGAQQSGVPRRTD